MKVKSRQAVSSIYTTIALLMAVAMTDVQASGNPEVVFETDKGSFRLELYPDKAPITVANFLKYVDDGFYDNTIFHRVIKGFVVQGGGFEPGLKAKETREAIKSESSNRLRNLRGTISMARRNHPDTATSQFYINLNHNADLDFKAKYMPGYTVFGKISKGMDVIDKISLVDTTNIDRRSNIPVEDVKVISARRAAGKPVAREDNRKAVEQKVAAAPNPVVYVAGEHYTVLDKPVPTRDSSKVEVVEMFSYGCPHCYEFEPLVKGWGRAQDDEIDFWFFPAVWNRPMNLYARAFYAAEELGVSDKVHMPLFKTIVVEQKSIRNEDDLVAFFDKQGVDAQAFSESLNSDKVRKLADEAEQRVKNYKPVGVPEIVVNGKYRIDRMRAGGMNEMLAVAEYLVEKERESLKQ